jgi:release factor glutamine methyltransferase
MLYKEIIPYIENKLKSGGINRDDVASEARIIAEDIGGITTQAAVVSPDTEILSGRLNAVNKIINTRIYDRIPLQYLVPLWDWYGVKLKLADGVLCPRQETELLVDMIKTRASEVAAEIEAKKAAEEKIADEPFSVLDLCTGSGNIAIAVKKQLPKAIVYAVDNSTLVTPMFKYNCTLNETEITFIQGSVTEQTTLAKMHDENGLPLRFDVIVCNPPYLTKLEMNNLQPELKHEPEAALYGGFDGLDFYRTIPILWKNNLKDGGLILFEIGSEQGKDVRRILNKAGYTNIKITPDYGGNDRAVSAIKE